jgi:hypothetical protein
MTNREKWNKIVELYNQHKYTREEVIQNTWENILSELFGYGKLFGEIDTHRSIQIGSTERAITDIIIKDKDKDLFLVEIKQQTLHTGEKQLLSYLKLLHIDIGILINNKITIYAYDYRKQDDEQIKHEIYYDLDSTDGELFVELFSKPFQTEQVRDFVTRKNISNKNVQEIKELIDKEYILLLLKAELSNVYAQTEIQDALQDIEIRVNRKNHKNTSGDDKSQGGTTTIDPNGLKIGQEVHNFFSDADNENSLSEEMTHKLCDTNYCRQNFKISRPVLKEILDLSKIDDYRKDNRGHARYYKDIFNYNGRNYILCSQWTTTQEPYFHEWKKFYEAKIIV